MREIRLIPIILVINFINLNNLFAQQVTLPAKPDSLFPVINLYNESYSVFAGTVFQNPSSVFNIVAKNSKYYMFGDFRNLAANRGSSLVLDTLTQNINTSQKWKINGRVNTSIPDGLGGFYIGGTFTQIGDSSRNYIAQIDKYGKPRPWNPVADSFITQISKRNDTLFIAGVFSHMANHYKPNFAMYSINGDSLLINGGYGPFTFMQGIRSFLIDRDTLIYSGTPYSYDGTINSQPIRKYNFRNNIFLYWVLPFIEYASLSGLQFNKDSSVIIYAAQYNGQYIRGINKMTGSQVYKLDPCFNFPQSGNNGTGKISGIKVLDDKAYLAGFFEKVITSSSTIIRSGFATFNATTGSMFNDALNINGYPSFLQAQNGRLYVSGKFSTINGITRINFVALDTGSYNINPWQISPTDPLTSLSFSNESVFISGYFNGINSTSRIGFAAVDSATNTILPWNPQNTTSTEGKRMFIQGDTLFILGITSRPSSCFTNDYNTEFRMISISTGAEFSRAPMMNYGTMNDFVVDGSYLYVSQNREIRRYNLPSLIKDLTWGINFTGAGYDHTPTYLLIKNDTIYSIGDTRFIYACTSFGPKQGWVMKYPKSTGVPVKYYAFQELDNQYTQPVFEHAVLSGNKLYLQGVFRVLNNNTRTDFACINCDNGNVTSWQAQFPDPSQDNPLMSRTSDLQLYNGKIWFGGHTGYHLNNGSYFSGFGSIDTASGILTSPPLLGIKQTNNTFNTNVVNDFILNDNDLFIAGSFDSANNAGNRCLAHYRLNNASANTYTFTGNGNWNNPSNWSNNLVPPSIVPTGYTIIIDPVTGGECLLNVDLTISHGSILRVITNKQFRILGNLIVLN